MTAKRLSTWVAVCVVAAAVWHLSNVQAKPERTTGRGTGPVIYVTSQGLCYDSIVTADPLPPHGPFQLLEEGGPCGLQTEFGPGNPGYRGGRWKKAADVPGGFVYFSCPLLGPGFPPED